MILDIIAIVLITFFIVSGIKSGFVKSFLKAASFLLSAILMFIFYGWTYDYLKASELSTFISTHLPDTGVLPADTATAVLVGIITAIALLIVIKFALLLVIKILGIATKIPVIKELNGLLGGVFGFITGAFWIILAITVTGVLSDINLIPEVSSLLDGSYIVRHIYENNLFLNILK